jgi:2-keto-4-pentenoate hydratase
MAATALSEIDIEAAVSDLESAERAARPTTLSADRRQLSLADGYRIQHAWTAARVADGATRAGWKVGATSTRSQAVLGASEPMFGALLSDTEIANGGHCSRASLIRPLFEAEIAFRVATVLAGPEPSVKQVLASCDALAGAIEVVDARVAADVKGPGFVVADRGRAGRYVLGEWVDVGAVASTADVGVAIHESDRELARGDGRRVLGDPARSVAWLVNALASQGLGLEPGDVVLAGTLTDPFPVSGGEHLRAVFDAPLGAVALQFT